MFVGFARRACTKRRFTGKTRTDRYSASPHWLGTQLIAGGVSNGTFDNSDVPVRVKGVENAEKIVAGDAHTCALLVNKTVICWGDNSYGQRGNGERTLSIAPVWVQGIN